MRAARARRLGLVLGGGGALGAFQAGLFAALDAAGLVPDRLAGSSIGAFNAVLIAGNPPERRVERLRSFWSLLAQPGSAGAERAGDARRVQKAIAAVGARVLGPPGLYAPIVPQLFLGAPRSGQPSLYHTAPALDTLRRFVDFDRIAAGSPRVAVNLTDLMSGESVLIDTAHTRLRREHVLASMGLLPDFPPVEIDGRWFCDGGFSANVPLHAIMDPPPAQDLLCVAVDLLGEPGPPVFSVDGMLERSNDLTFCNQTRTSVALLGAKYAQRTSGGAVALILVALDGRSERIAQKTWDYGRSSILERWRAGEEAGAAVVEQIGILKMPAPGRLAVHRIVAVPTPLKPLLAARSLELAHLPGAGAPHPSSPDPNEYSTLLNRAIPCPNKCSPAAWMGPASGDARSSDGHAVNRSKEDRRCAASICHPCSVTRSASTDSTICSRRRSATRRKPPIRRTTSCGPARISTGSPWLSRASARMTSR